MLRLLLFEQKLVAKRIVMNIIDIYISKKYSVVLENILKPC